MAFKFPKISRDLLIAGGIAILGAATLVQLHNQEPNVVPTVPGLKYGSGNPATGFYTGDEAPYTPVPVLNEQYQKNVRPISSTIQQDVRKGVETALPEDTVQAMWGGYYGQGGVGRGFWRDAWTDVYNPKTVSSKITGDNPDVRVTLA